MINDASFMQYLSNFSKKRRGGRLVPSGRLRHVPLIAPCNLVACMRTGQTVLLTEGRRWSIWLLLLLQSFKHDAVIDAESEIGASTMLVAF